MVRTADVNRTGWMGRVRAAAELDKAVAFVQMHVVALAPKVPVRKHLRVALAVNALARRIIRAKSARLVDVPQACARKKAVSGILGPCYHLCFEAPALGLSRSLNVRRHLRICKHDTMWRAALLENLFPCRRCTMTDRCCRVRI